MPKPDPSPSDFDRWELALAHGEEPSQAAADLGYTASGFRRANPDRHAMALAMGRLARADYVDRTMETQAIKEDPAPAVLLAWAKRWNPAYTERQQLEVTGRDGGPLSIEDRSANLDAVGAVLVAVGALGADGGRPVGPDVPAVDALLAESEAR